MKKLIFIISNTNIGGPQKSLLALLDRIDYSRFSVDVVSIRPDGKIKEYYNENVRFIEVPEVITAATIPSYNTAKYLRVILKKMGIGSFFSALWTFVKSRKKNANMNKQRQAFWKKNVKKLPLLENDYDAGFGILGMSTYYLADCVNAKKKYHWIRSDTRILNRDETIDAEYFRRMTGFLSVSKDCADIFTEIYPFSAGKIKTFYNYIPTGFYERMACDTSLLDSAGNKTKLLTVCRLDPLKGLDMAMDACVLLKERNVDFCWYVLGDGSFRETIEEEIRKRSISDCFVLLGFQLNTMKFIEKADIVVHPSRTEGKSNAVDEAKYAGKPIVVTEYPTAKEVLTDHVNGLICEMNGKAIADSVCELIGSPELARRLADECRKESSDGIDANAFLEDLVK